MTRFPPPKSICPSGKRSSSNLSEHARQTLKQWFNKHADYPYPDENEKKQLVEQSGLILSQVKTWFANTRRRKRITTSKSSLKYQKITKNYHQYDCSSQTLTDSVAYALDNSVEKVGLYHDEEHVGQIKMDNKKLQDDQCLFKVQESGYVHKGDYIISKEMEQNKEQDYCLENKEMKIKSDTKDSQETKQLNSVLFENTYPVLQTQNFIIPKENNYCNFTSEQKVDAVENVCSTYNLPTGGEYPDNLNILQDCAGIKSGENALFPNGSEAVNFTQNDTVLMPDINSTLPVTMWQLPLLPTGLNLSYSNISCNRS